MKNFRAQQYIANCYSIIISGIIKFMHYPRVAVYMTFDIKQIVRKTITTYYY